MSDHHYTVAGLRRVLARNVGSGELADDDLLARRDEQPVVVLISGENEYVKAYATSIWFVKDNLPDTDGGDDIHNSASMLLIEAHLPEDES